MQEGKLSWDLLKQIVTKKGAPNEGIIQGPKPGCDVAVFDNALGKKKAQEFYNSSAEVYTVFKTDPITFPTTNPGRYAVLVNSNDIVTSGALPYGFNTTVIVPVGTTPAKIVEIQEGIHYECLNHGISVLGGHTEASSSVNTPIVSGAMLGFVPKDYFVPRELAEGDMLVCVGWCAKEGMGILASEGYEKLLEHLSEKKLAKLQELGNDISVVAAALAINKTFRPGLMHDATEGGIIGAIYETIATENYGLELFGDKFPLTKETQELCSLLGINPLKVISSGTLLVVAPEETAKKLKKESFAGNPVEIIGRITQEGASITIDGTLVQPPGPDAVIDGLRKIAENDFE